MMRHVSISPRCFCCIGWHDAECAVPERAARSAAAPLFFALAFAARVQWSGRIRAGRRGARREQSRNDEATRQRGGGEAIEFLVYRSRIATDRAARMRDGSARHGRDESRDPSSGRRGGQKRCSTFK